MKDKAKARKSRDVGEVRTTRVSCQTVFFFFSRSMHAIEGGERDKKRTGARARRCGYLCFYCGCFGCRCHHVGFVTLLLLVLEALVVHQFSGGHDAAVFSAWERFLSTDTVVVNSADLDPDVGAMSGPKGVSDYSGHAPSSFNPAMTWFFAPK